MKLIVVALVALALVSAVLADKNQARFRHKASTKWHEFKSKHLGTRKHLLKDDEEEERRFKNFEASDAIIQEHKALFESGETTFEIGHNFMSVLDDDEKRAMAGGVGDETVEEHLSKRANSDIFWWDRKSSASNPLPASVDWRTKGWNTAVRDQGQCGSCWAFAAIAATEAQVWIATGNKIDLSEQMLVDCFAANCNANNPVAAMNYIIDNGIQTRAARQYWSHNKNWGACNLRTPLGTTSTSYGARTVSRLYKVRQGANAQQDGMDMLRYNGPMTICINMQSNAFMYYKNGIYNNWNDIGTRCNHIVTIVGYGTDGPNQDYWIIRNSWGANWGIGGYMKMARNGNNYGELLNYMTSPFIATSAGRTRPIG